MPVARIVTRFAQEAAPLIGRLRARGYTIEIVDPGTFRVTPADLEIELQRLRTPEALSAAVRFARERDAEVFVAAGLPLDEASARALRGAAVARGNVVVDGLKKLIAPFRRLGAEAHGNRAARRQRVLEQELAREAERKQRAELKEQGLAARGVREQEEQERKRVLREAAQARQRGEREAQLARQREEEERRQTERAAAAARQRAEEARLRREQEALGVQRRAEEAARRAEETQVAAQREAELARRLRAEETERERAAEAARLAAEEQERRRVAEEIAAAESERRREEERRRAMAGAAALVEAQRRKAEELRLRKAAAAAEPRVVERAGSRAMKRAFVAAAGVAILMTIAWGAYQNRMPASPLTNQQRVRGAEIQQEVPFGAATIKPQAKPAAQPAKPAAQKTQAKPAPGGAPKPSPKRTQRYADNDVDMIAEDEIVYHGAPRNSKSRAANQQQQNGVKKISDLDGDDE